MLVAGAFAAPVLDPAVSPHEGWPQFRGRARDGVVAEKGLLQSWPKGGPSLLWSVKELGRGWSQPTIVGDTLYITGDVGESCRIFALGLDGKRKWAADNGKAWKKSYPGARATCTYFKGDLFHMNGNGRAVCLDPATGKERWAVNILERFNAPNIRWGISECLLVDGDEVIVTPGGPEALMAALDRKTGATLWKTGPLRFMREHKFGGDPVEPPAPDTDKTGYASPVVARLGDKRLIFGCSSRHLFCVDADRARIMWTQPVYARYEVISSMPAVWNDSVYFSAPDKFGGKFFRVGTGAGDDGIAMHALWNVPVDICQGSAVIVGDRLFAAGHRRHQAWTSVDVKTGEIQCTKDDLHKGAAVHADRRLYALAENGVFALLEPTRDGFESRGEIVLTDGKRKDVWAHPVILDGRLYLRYHDSLWCYDIRR